MDLRACGLVGRGCAGVLESVPGEEEILPSSATLTSSRADGGVGVSWNHEVEQCA